MAAPAPSSQNPTSSSSASSSPLPSVHKTTASGHNLLVRIPDGPSGALTARQAEPEHPMLWGMQLRYVSLVTLALQNASLTIIMHYSRISAAPTAQYSAATAVLMNELLKGSISLVIALKRIDDELTANEKAASARRGSFTALSPATLYAATEKEQHGLSSPDAKASAGQRSFFPSLASIASSAAGGARPNGGHPASGTALSASPLATYLAKDWPARTARLRSELFSPDCWKLSIPAILYVVQNNLQYVAASNLDVATFQVTYQMKILTTAGFSVIMLGKRLTPFKWFALGCLALGVGIVQIQGQAAAPGGGGGHGGHGDMSPFKGFVAVTAACFTSGLAGVYFEKVLKGSQADLWIRNVQLSLFSLVPAVLPVLFAPATPSSAPGGAGLLAFLAAPFAHFNVWAWATVAIQVLGGLVTAVVIKYSDNILKGFATSLSIVISFLVSVGFFGYQITPAFVLGSSTVLGATWMYNQPETTSAGARGRSKPDGRESRAPGSPVPANAPIIGDFRKSAHSAPSSMTNLMNLLTSSLTPTPSAAPTPRHSGANSPDPDAFGGRRSSSSGSTVGASPALGGYFTPAEGSVPGTPHHLGAAWDDGKKAQQGWSS